MSDKDGDGAWNYGDLKFVNGLLVGAPTDGNYKFAYREEPEDPI